MYEKLINGCWQWKGKTRSQGRYGYIVINGRTLSAHRYYCETIHGAAPHGAYCCHKCGNSLCVNPEHLYWGTPRTNFEDSRKNMITALSKGWGKKGAENPNCKISESDYKQRSLRCKELRDSGLSWGEVAKRLKLKSRGHARQMYLAN